MIVTRELPRPARPRRSRRGPYSARRTRQPITAATMAANRTSPKATPRATPTITFSTNHRAPENRATSRSSRIRSAMSCSFRSRPVYAALAIRRPSVVAAAPDRENPRRDPAPTSPRPVRRRPHPLAPHALVRGGGGRFALVVRRADPAGEPPDAGVRRTRLRGQPSIRLDPRVPLLPLPRGGPGAAGGRGGGPSDRPGPGRAANGRRDRRARGRGPRRRLQRDGRRGPPRPGRDRRGRRGVRHGGGRAELHGRPGSRPERRAVHRDGPGEPPRGPRGAGVPERLRDRGRGEHGPAGGLLRPGVVRGRGRHHGRRLLPVLRRGRT